MTFIAYIALALDNTRRTHGRTLYLPRALVSLCVPPAPGIRPIETSGKPNCDSDVATMKSACVTFSKSLGYELSISRNRYVLTGEIGLPSTRAQNRPQAARLVGMHPIEGSGNARGRSHWSGTYSLPLDGGDDGLAHVAQAVAQVLEVAHPPGIFGVQLRDFFDVGPGCARSTSVCLLCWVLSILSVVYFWPGIFGLSPHVWAVKAVLLCWEAGRLGGGWGRPGIIKNRWWTAHRKRNPQRL